MRVFLALASNIQTQEYDLKIIWAADLNFKSTTAEPGTNSATTLELSKNVHKVHHCKKGEEALRLSWPSTIFAQTACHHQATLTMAMTAVNITCSTCHWPYFTGCHTSLVFRCGSTYTLAEISPGTSLLASTSPGSSGNKFVNAASSATGRTTGCIGRVSLTTGFCWLTRISLYDLISLKNLWFYFMTLPEPSIRTL